MATRYQSLTTSASLVLASAVGGALYTAASAHDARGTLGVSADPTTAVGDTVYRASALPDAGLQRLAVGVDASVLTSINGVPTWQAASGGITTPTTLAGQQRLDTTLRRGPLATLGQSTGVGWSASSTATAAPTIARGTSGVVVVYSTQAGAYTGGYLLSSVVWPTRGWFVFIANGTGNIGVMAAAATPPYATFTNAVATTGWHAVAWSISSDGATVRYSLDGAAAANATITDGPMTFVARVPGDPVWVLTDGSSAGSSVPVAYLGLWSSVLSDADLALLSASPSSGAPNLAAIAGGAPAWEWAAAPAATLDRMVIAGDTYAISSTRPRTWMP